MWIDVFLLSHIVLSQPYFVIPIVPCITKLLSVQMETGLQQITVSLCGTVSACISYSQSVLVWPPGADGLRSLVGQMIVHEMPFDSFWTNQMELGHLGLRLCSVWPVNKMRKCTVIALENNPYKHWSETSVSRMSVPFRVINNHYKMIDMLSWFAKCYS